MVAAKGMGSMAKKSSDEIKGQGNSYTAEFWEYEPRIGKRWNTDPVINPGESPYTIRTGVFQGVS